MKLRSAFFGLLLLTCLAVLAACDSNATPTPVATSLSVSNPTTSADQTQPTTAVEGQPTQAPVEGQPTGVTQPDSTPAAQPTAAITEQVTGRATGSPSKTDPAIVFMPRRGGPGTRVNITGGNFAPGKTVTIRIGIPEPMGESLGTAVPGEDGRWNTSIELPATEPSGKAITATELQIVVMDENNQPLTSAAFTFMPK